MTADNMYPNLKLQIFKRGLHQNHLARNLGIDETLLSKIIHGYREPTPVQRRSLAGFLAVEEEWLFERYEGSLQKVDATERTNVSEDSSDGGS
jgi:transcriptional regulator with XRE-family HTH domain